MTNETKKPSSNQHDQQNIKAPKKEAFTEKQDQIIMYIRFSMKHSIHCIVTIEEMLLLSKSNSQLFRQNDYNKDI